MLRKASPLEKGGFKWVLTFGFIPPALLRKASPLGKGGFKSKLCPSVGADLCVRPLLCASSSRRGEPKRLKDLDNYA